MNKFFNSLRCLICGKEYSPDKAQYICPDHNHDGTLDVNYNYDIIKKKIERKSLEKNPDCSMWRYKPLLPIDAALNLSLLRVGWTPLYNSIRLSDKLNLKSVWIKNEGQQPTGSLKDRASALAIYKAHEIKANVIATASTGNAGAALSGLCASANQKNIIFLPKSAPAAKIAQLQVYGSTIILVNGSYDDAFNLCRSACELYGWYNRNTGYNPYMTEGKKTVAHEICEQLNWNVPDIIIVSVGDGCIIGAVHKGLKDLLALGWINKMPRLIGVQAAGSNYLSQAWENDEDLQTKPPIKANTIADSISAGLPRDRFKAMNAVKNTNGIFVTVTDEEILSAIPELARNSGVFAEPAGAASFAGLKKCVEKNIITSDESVVIINTGNGLKDIKSTQQAIDKIKSNAHKIYPDIRELKNLEKFLPN